jgi:hypothetical protein
LPDQVRDAWWTLFDLSERFPTGWTVIGAQMVALHGAAGGKVPPRSSRDADVLANARVLRPRPYGLVEVLLKLGFVPDIATDGIAHRFRRGHVSIDVLAPEGLKPRSPALRTLPAHVTIQVPGGTQAIQRTETVEISAGGRSGVVPCPNLLGALVLKACAVAVSDHMEDQRLDFAFLCGLIPDPRAVRASLTPADLRRLRARGDLKDERADAWRRLGSDGADAYRAFRILTG